MGAEQVYFGHLAEHLAEDATGAAGFPHANLLSALVGARLGLIVCDFGTLLVPFELLAVEARTA